jgi:hypothetical protein
VADGRLRSLAFKLYGEPPPAGAPRSQLLRWIRGIYVRLLPLTVLAYAMLVVWASQTWVFVVLAVTALLWLQGVVSLSVKIGREERRERG